MEQQLLHQAVAYIFGAILTGIGGWAVFQWRKINAVQIGLQALLRDRLIQGHDFYTEKGYMPVYARTNFENCYQAYKGLGADGVIDDIVSAVKKLPTTKAKE